MEVVKAFLEQFDIQHVWYNHEPVFTVEEAKKTRANIKGLHCKNLFLRNQKGNKHFLVIFPADLPVDMKVLAPKIGINRISFASAQRLDKYLKVKPGAVSIFGLLHDQEQAVELYLHQDILQADTVTFHPNDNAATVALSQEAFRKVLEYQGRSYQVLE